MPLPAKGKCSMSVEFDPAAGASGTLNATLSIDFTYGPNSGGVSINLAGKVKLPR
jgi:hypothetical protein